MVKKEHLTLLIIFISSLIICMSCGKDEQPDEEMQENEEMEVEQEQEQMEEVNPADQMVITAFHQYDYCSGTVHLNGRVITDLKVDTLGFIFIDEIATSDTLTGTDFKKTIEDLELNKTYTYRPFVIYDSQLITGRKTDFILETSSHTLPSENIIRLSDFPGIPRYEGVSFTANGKGYMCCGKSDGEFMNDFWEYDPNSDTWVELPNFPGSPAAFHTSFVIGDFAYVGYGGTDINNQLEGNGEIFKYDLTNQSWSEIENKLDVTGFAGVSFVIDDIAYITNLLGGSSGSGMDQIIKFDPPNDTWSTITPSNTLNANNQNMALSLNNTGYFVNAGFAQNVNTFMSIYSFDPRSESWQLQESFFNASNDGLALPVNDKIYTITGRGNLGIIEYDPISKESKTYCNNLDGIIRSEAIGFAFENEIIISNGVEYNLDSQIHDNPLASTYKLILE